jgi:signal transduction histidine kinase
MSWPNPDPPFHGDFLVEGVARQVLTDINQFFSKDRLARAAMQDERVRLARELHDGLLQSLTGASLQLEALSRLIDENPDAARNRLRVIGDLIAEEQRELRIWIQKVEPTARPAAVTGAQLAAALETLCRRVESQWDLRVELHKGNTGIISRTLADEVYRLVQEALTNTARHANASLARVDFETSRDRVHITVADDGHGFPYLGRYNLAILMEKQLGPSSLKHRIDSLDGDLILVSNLSGSRLEISLPLVQQGRAPVSSAPATGTSL